MNFIDLNLQQIQLGALGQSLRENIDYNISKVLDHGKYILGPEVDELEYKLKEFVGTKECITVSSGTDALLVALLALDLKKGDEIVFTKLDRGFKNQRQCINTLYELQERGIHVRTTDEMINTRALGKFAPIVIGLLSGLGEVERQMVIERTQESINHRRETGGNLGGRPKINNEKEALVLRLRNEGCSYRSIRKQTGLALSTIRRIIVEQDVVIEV